MNINLSVVFLLLFLVFIFAFYRLSNYRRRKNLSIYKWMKISKSRRNTIDNKEKADTLNRKTSLINKTRNEYLKLYKKQSH